MKHLRDCRKYRSLSTPPPHSKLPFPEYAIALTIRLTNITYSNL